MKKIKLFSPSIDQKEINAVKNVLKSGDWAMGERVEEFERKFARKMGFKHCITVNSGSSALFLAQKVLNIEKYGVFTPAFTFVSAVHGIIQNNAFPSFVDVSPIDFNINPEEINFEVQTKVIQPVHFGGYPANIKKLRELCDDWGMFIIEDNAHLCTHVGVDRGDLACYSFYPCKPLAMPNGGAVCTNTDKFAWAIRRLREFGIGERGNTRYTVVECGYNMKLNDVCASIGLVQLEKLEELRKYRLEVAKTYIDAFEKKEVYTRPFNKDSSYHLFPILLDAKKRKEFTEYMFKNKIEVGTHYQNITTFKFYKKFSKKLPITEDIDKRIVTLPIHNLLSEKDIEFIIEKTLNFIKK